MNIMTLSVPWFQSGIIPETRPARPSCLWHDNDSSESSQCRLFHSWERDPLEGNLLWRNCPGHRRLDGMETGNYVCIHGICLFRLFWISLVFILYFPGVGIGETNSPVELAAYLLIWGLLVAGLFIGTLNLTGQCRSYLHRS